jgi:hypothetical protein
MSKLQWYKLSLTINTSSYGNTLKTFYNENTHNYTYEIEIATEINDIDRIFRNYPGIQSYNKETTVKDLEDFIKDYGILFRPNTNICGEVKDGSFLQLTYNKRNKSFAKAILKTNDYYDFFLNVKEILLNQNILDYSFTKLDTPKYIKTSFSYEVKHNEFWSYAVKEIARRYASFRNNSTKNLLIDSTLPWLFINYHFNLNYIKDYLDHLPKTASFIHRGFANYFGKRAVPIDVLVSMLNYDMNTIKENLLKIKDKQLNFIFVGIGGTGMNALNWMYELCNYNNIIGLFKKVHIYEPETPTLDNILRYPGEFTTLNDVLVNQFNNNVSDALTHSTNMTEVLPVCRTLYKANMIPTKYLDVLSKTSPNINTYRLPFYYLSTLEKNSIFYGAPDIETRQAFTKYRNNYNCKTAFITGLHGNDSCSLMINPIYKEGETNLLVESYGIIQLNVFFLNQIKMCIELINLLANKDINELREIEDEVYLNYSCIKDKKLKKTYNLGYREITTITETTNDNI